MTVERNFHGPNLGYILELYDQFQDDPESLDASSRGFFQNWKPPRSAPAERSPTPDLPRLSRLLALAHAIRARGYLAATLDPLGTKPANDPSLTPGFHQMNADDLQ